MNRHYYWEDIQVQIQTIYDNMHIHHAVLDRTDKCIERVIGITNGGVIPATLLAKKFDSRVDAIDPHAPAKDLLKKLHKNEYSIIFDDISDSGATFKRIMRQIPKAYREYVVTASLLCKIGSEYKPDYYANTVDRDVWAIFPWENGVED